MSTSGPGSIIHGTGDLVLNEGRETTALDVTNAGDRAVQIGSHYHFFEVNAALRFDRLAAFGRRLDIPSGTSVRFEAGQTHQVTLVPYGGRRQIAGFNGLTGGGSIETAIARAAEQGFLREGGDR